MLNLAGMAPERVVLFRARTILTVLAIVVAVAVVLQIVWLARGVLVWVLVALFLALALNPAVEALQRRGLPRRGASVAVVSLGVLAGLAALGATVIPILVDQVNDFAGALPATSTTSPRAVAGWAISRSGTTSSNASARPSRTAAPARHWGSPERPSP